MKFGSVDQPELVDFKLPKDHPDTLRVLNEELGYDLHIPTQQGGQANLF